MTHDEKYMRLALREAALELGQHVRQRPLDVGAPLVLLGEEELAVHPVAQLQVVAQVVAIIRAHEPLVAEREQILEAAAAAVELAKKN